MRKQRSTVPTIKDVAKAANVSIATVSRSLTTPQRVSQETRKHVEAVVAAIGYVANETASNLRRKRTGSIMVVLPVFGNPFFSKVLDGISSVLSAEGFHMLVVDSASFTEDYWKTSGTKGSADGMIVLSGITPKNSVLKSSLKRMPIVMANTRVPDLDLPSVTVDNSAGAKLAIDHLIALGHRKIAYVAGPVENIVANDRLAATRAAMESNALSLCEEWTFRNDFTTHGGIQSGKVLLSLNDRPSAVFCASDEMAFGLISELNRAGVSVPDDVSVVGFDDIELSEHFIPALTTIRQPRFELGRLAAELVMSKLLKGTLDGSGKHLLNVELIKRDSTKFRT